jgi:hypothetical protein
MSHHVFIPKKPIRHHVGFGVLVGLVVAGVIAGWTFTTGRAMLATMDAAGKDLGAAVETAREVRDKVAPAPEPAPQEAIAPAAEEPEPNFDPVIAKMKEKLEADQTTTETTE